MRGCTLLMVATAALGACEPLGLVINPKNTNGGDYAGQSLPVEISHLMNNRGFAMFAGDADFDGTHAGYPAQYLPPANFTYGGVNYIFPQYRASGNDNVLAQGQKLDVLPGRYTGVRMLCAAESAVATGYIDATYADKSTSTGSLLVDPFWAWPYPYGGDIIFPYYWSNTSVDFNRSMVFQTINWLDSTKELTSLQLPNVSAGAANGPGGSAEDTRLHIFSVSMIPAQSDGLVLEVQYARASNMWFEGTNKTQIVEATISNVGTEWVLANHSVQVTVRSPGLNTVQPAVINRLRPGDQASVQIGVVNAPGVAAGSTGPASITITGVGIDTNLDFNATYGFAPYEATYESIYTHESPMWYNDAKFGIFIHWGIYSVPGWGNVGNNESYAEWYWWWENLGPNMADYTYEYNLATYGPEHVYDEFLPNFTASVFDPKEWVDLFADAGAQYFVQVSKHHDGYALFDLPENVTKRTSVAQPPYRNLLRELFDAAAQYQPQLHRATYFSLPEWFNPAYKQYGFGQWPGGNATNPYTNETLEYTGFVPVDDYISDIILPSMLTLADMGTEIMWCDIGGPNLTAEFAAQYFNEAANNGKQVVLNNRCGLPGDFDTPEYARYDAVQVRKWESNLGMDPFSYGYNRATPEDAYLTPGGIVTSLVDIVSKNGNFLLDVGPTANGTIIQVEQDHLRAAGRWIKDHAEAIYGTRYWYITPGEGQAIRFLTTPDAFYISTIYAPNSTLIVNSPVPYLQGDHVTVVGGNMSGTVVPSALTSNGSLELTISEAIRQADQFAWVFKIPYNGTAVPTNGTAGGNGTATNSAPSTPATATKGKASVPSMPLSLEVFTIALLLSLWIL